MSLSGFFHMLVKKKVIRIQCIMSVLSLTTEEIIYDITGFTEGYNL